MILFSKHIISSNTCLFYFSGTKDLEGGALILVDGSLLEAAALRAPELARVLLFYTSLLEREESNTGVTVLLSPSPPQPDAAAVYKLLDEAFALVAKTLRVRVVLVTSPAPDLPSFPFPKSKVPVSILNFDLLLGFC